jgi:hypothetical protein
VLLDPELLVLLPEPELLDPELLVVLLKPELLDPELPVLLLEPELPLEPKSPLLDPELPELPLGPEPPLAPDAPADPELPFDPELLALDPPTLGEELERSPLVPQAVDAAIARAIARVLRTRMEHPLLSGRRGVGQSKALELSPLDRIETLCPQLLEGPGSAHRILPMTATSSPGRHEGRGGSRCHVPVPAPLRNQSYRAQDPDERQWLGSRVVAIDVAGAATGVLGGCNASARGTTGAAPGQAASSASQATSHATEAAGAHHAS